MTRRSALFALFVALLVGACALLPRSTPTPGVPCEQLYSEDDCLAMVELATIHLGKSPDDVVAIAITPNPTEPPGSTSGAAPPMRLRLTLKDGANIETLICGGVSMEPVCSAQPRATPE